MTRACILGCAGLALTPEEIALYRDARPWGFILFKRNIDNPDQTRALVDQMRECVGVENAPVLIDQEGGRVRRLRPPHWPDYPPAQAFAQATNDPMTARELARLGGRLIAHDLRALGINVDCAPVLDVPQPGAHDIIGDRAFGAEPARIAALGRAQAEGLLAGGVLPVIKHIPGHGRAMADSHHDLPVVDAPRKQLEAVDFSTFRANSDMPAAMTAHIVYTAIDRQKPATQSRKVMSVVRKDIGFSGLVITDDLSMKALGGDFQSRARDSVAAGCDVVLHCNGVMEEMKGVVAGAGELKGEARRRAAQALARIVREPEPLDVEWARARFAEYFDGVVARAGPAVGEA
ncbi:MAG: beta-N-acetylhexosaminidase [Caulobacteraceae bacterium]|nr:beta-N-acetylhexosaminidase [Caulobacteraceae bacterium]